MRRSLPRSQTRQAERTGFCASYCRTYCQIAESNIGTGCGIYDGKLYRLFKKYPICGSSDPVPTIRKTMKAIHPYACPRCCRLPANTFRTGMANSASILHCQRRQTGSKRRKRRRICPVPFAGQQDCRGVGILPFATLILRDIRQILWEVSAFAYNAPYLTNFVNFIKRNKRWLPSTTKLKK